MKLSLKVGGVYMNGFGERIGPMAPTARLEYPFQANGKTYTAAGLYSLKKPCAYDLVSEYIEPAKEAEMKMTLKKYQRGERVKILGYAKRLDDGQFVRSFDGTKVTVEHCYFATITFIHGGHQWEIYKTAITRRLKPRAPKPKPDEPKKFSCALSGIGYLCVNRVDLARAFEEALLPMSSKGPAFAKLAKSLGFTEVGEK